MRIATRSIAGLFATKPISADRTYIQVNLEDTLLVVYPDGQLRWGRYGFNHRSQGPACLRALGFLEWHREGLLHREDGPAQIYPDNTRYWCLQGTRVGHISFQDLVATWRDLRGVL